MLLILSAMPQEIEALLPTLDPVSRIQSGGREVASKTHFVNDKNTNHKKPPDVELGRCLQV